MKPNISYDELLERLNSVDDVKKRQVILDIGENRLTDAYRILRLYIGTNLEHQALIAMSRINYYATLDIIVSLLRRDLGRSQMTEHVKTLSCIFGDRLDDLGEEGFLEDLRYFLPLDNLVKNTFVCSINDCLKLTDITDASNYSHRVGMSLFR